MASGNGSGSNDVTVGIVGDGFGSLLVYTTAVYLGFAPERIGIFGNGSNPVGTYQQFAWNLGQTILRSESESHFLPADWPTFSQLDAWSRKDPSPLFRSAGRKFNPGVPEILTEATLVTRMLGYENRVIGNRHVGWIVREPGPPPYFSLYDDDAELIGRAKHLMVAIGHGPLSFPGIYGEARENPETADRIVQSYEPKQYYPGGRYVVVGSGIAAINEWANIVDAGASCIALQRNPEPEEQDLNVPRCLFDGSGIDAFAGLPFEQRLDFLGRVLRGTAPERRTWAQKVANAQREGRFEQVFGTVTNIGSSPGGLVLEMKLLNGDDPGELEVTGVTCATGFVKSALALPLIRRLAQSYDVPIVRERIRLKTNCGIPPLDRPDSRLAMMGIQANTVVPNGDTIAGLKYIARRFVGDCVRADLPRQRSFPSRFGMQLKLAGATSKALKQVRKSEQLA